MAGAVNPPQAGEGINQDGDAYARALQVAFRYLAFRPRSVSEVRKRLGREFAADTIERVVTALVGYRYLDDADFAVRWRESRERRRPRGAALLKSELRRKGVDDDLIDTALDGLDDSENAYRAGLRKAERWIAKGVDRNVFRRKMWDFLQRRGFGAKVSRETVERFWDEFAPAVGSEANPADGDEDAADDG